MRTVQRYQANDGTEWTSEEKAIERDRLLSTLADAAGILRPPVGDREGYVQQDPAAVLRYKRRLVAVAKRVIGGDWWKDPVEEIHPMGIAGRVIDDSGCEPLSEAWFRLQCMDDQGREWQQPYYALNSGKGPNKAL